MGTNARDIGPVSEAVSEELRALLARHKMSVRAFAQTHNLPLTTLHKTLNAQRVVDVEDLYSICEPLGADPAEILDAAIKAADLRAAAMSEDLDSLTVIEPTRSDVALAAKRGKKHTEEP